MGEACSKRQQTRAAAIEDEPDIQFPEYKSEVDSYLTQVENKYNYLKYFQLYEFIISLTNLKVDDETDHLTRSRLEELEDWQFNSFIENKVIKNFLVNSMLNGDQEFSDVFKTYMSEIFSFFQSACGILNKRKKLKGKKVKKIKKLYLMVIGFLLCNSNNRSRINFLFNLFQDESGLYFSKSEELEDFLFFLFLLPSVITLYSIVKLSDSFPSKFQKIDPDQNRKFDDAFEFQDIYRLIEIFMSEFFKGKDMIERNEYMDRFNKSATQDSFGWIFNPSGVRQYLAKHNDVKPVEENEEEIQA